MVEWWNGGIVEWSGTWSIHCSPMEPPFHHSTVPPFHKKSELRATIDLALPMVLVQVGMMSMGFIDTMMVGRVSGAVLAAVGLGNIYFFNISIFGTGSLQALDPLVAQAIGARDEGSVVAATQRGAVLAVCISVITILAFLPSAQVLRALGQSKAVVGEASAFLIISTLGVLPFFAFVVFR